MIQLSVRIELQDATYGPVCSFIIPSHLFVLPPFRGDHIIFGNGVYVTVSQYFHYAVSKKDDYSALVITDPYSFDEHDKLLRALDWFKENYEIQDFQAKGKPVSYYSFYRSLVQLMGYGEVTKLSQTTPDIKLFCEGCRTIVIAEWLDSNLVNTPLDDIVNELFGGYNQHILALTNFVLATKVDEPDGADILDLVKKWLSDSISLNMGFKQDAEWTASLRMCQQVGRIVFGRLRSVPNDALPKFMRD